MKKYINYSVKNMTDFINAIVNPQEVVKNSYVKTIIVRHYKHFYRLTRPNKTRGIRFEVKDEK